MIKVGIAGLGTVGLGTYSILSEKTAMLTARAGQEIAVTAVASRNKAKDRGVDFGAITWHENTIDLAADDNVDVVVEAIGGEKGIAYDVVKAALENGKHVVTANKALIAVHGAELVKLAEEKQVALQFEAAVAGGIPIIKALKEGMVANEVQKVYGIMNGTCNYILTAMRETRRDFADILVEAQAKGYAETPPDLDVDGIDTAHKLAILTSVAFGTPLNFDGIYSEGIRDITLEDIDYAREFGFAIKLLGITERVAGGVEQRVHPCLVALDSQIGAVEDVLNAVTVKSDSLGTACLTGAGAGAGPTASSVVADIIDIAAGRISPSLGILTCDLHAIDSLPMEGHKGEYYLRIKVKDESGVLSDITATLSKADIGVENIVQKPLDGVEQNDGASAQIALTTHETYEHLINNVTEILAGKAYTLETPHMIRIEAV